jgi:cytochrome c553
MNATMKNRILILLCVLLASPVAVASEGESANGASAAPLYRVEEGNKVDAKTLAGWKTWRALACERCHGAEQEGLVGPALVDSMKKLTKDEFRTTIMDGRLEKGMPPFSSSKMVSENWEGLYAYLKGRSDGRILPGRLSLLDDKQVTVNPSGTGASPDFTRITSSTGWIFVVCEALRGEHS